MGDATTIGYQADGSYVPCPECQYVPAPDSGPDFGVAIPVMPRRPGTALHRGDCSTIPQMRAALDRLADQKLDQEGRMRALQAAFDDAVGMVIDLIEAFPPGFPLSHLAESWRATRLPELVELVSAERQAEWAENGVKPDA